MSSWPIQAGSEELMEARRSVGPFRQAQRSSWPIQAGSKVSSKELIAHSGRLKGAHGSSEELRVHEAQISLDELR
jgi:hypothetical protein